MPFGFKRTRDNYHQYAHDLRPQLGPRIADYFRQNARRNPPKPDQPFPWHLAGAELLRTSLAQLAGEQEASKAHEYTVVVDVHDVLQNTGRSWAHLLEVCDIYGFSGGGFTPNDVEA